MTKNKNNNELAEKLLKKFDIRFKKLVQNFMESLDNNSINLCEYENGEKTISNELENKISDIIHSINYFKIQTIKEIDAVLDTIEYIDHHDTIINWQRNKYCKLKFYFINPISHTQRITWGKHDVEIYLPTKGDRFTTFRHPRTPEKYEVGRTYTLLKTGTNVWSIKNEDTKL